MTKAMKALELFNSNPNISSAEFVSLLQTKLGMSLAGARTYAYNVRKNSQAPQPKKQKVVKVPVVKGVKKIADVSEIKKKNLETLKATSKSLKKKDSYREMLDDVIKDREPNFDPQLAREEIEGIINAQGLAAKPGKTHD